MLFFVVTGTNFTQVCFLKNTFRKNLFPGHFMDRCIMIFLDKIFIVKEVVITVPKKKLESVCHFLGKQSFVIRKKRCKFVSLHFLQCKLQVIFNSNNRLRNFFSFKDKIPLVYVLMYFIVIRVIAARLPILEKRDVTMGYASLSS